ncbi:MAG: hypothetical protein KF845_00925 [Cyclobacteriaceae bacterium]|nr:hypothetical protein [Cyclobacteriaceae bacterium]
MKHIVFESSPGFMLLCLVAGVGYAWLLYTSKHPWGIGLNRALFVVRAVTVFLLTFFLLGPIIRHAQNTYEKPVFVLLQDNSLSVKESTDSVVRNQLEDKVHHLQSALADKGYEAVVMNLSGDGFDKAFEAPATNVHEALRAITNRYEGRNVAGTLFVSDGIYNTGLSPAYGNYAFPVYTVGVGDTTPRADLMIKNLVYNKVAYQGNRFPLRVEVAVKGFPSEEVEVSLRFKNSVIDRQTRRTTGDGLLVFDFQPEATEQGIQRWDIQVETKPQEQNVKNNRASVFIEVVEGKKKILVVAAAPHPDIKALRSVIDLNSNFEFLLHIPGLEETTSENLKPENIDLAIFHQSPDQRGRTRELFQRFARSRTSLFMIVGSSTDLNPVAQQQLPLLFEQPPRQFDEVTPAVNPAFLNFTLSAEVNTAVAGYPPVQVHFGKLLMSPSAIPVLFQRVGNLTTEKPLLYVLNDDRKTAIMLGEGMWRWRLHEFSRTEKTEAFDELIGKLVQFLSTTDDKRKFRSYTTQQQFADTEPVVFESQVYNDIYEPVYGNTISLELTDEQGKRTQYSYIINPGNSRYAITGLREGVYRYRAATTLDSKTEEIRGQFLVYEQQIELQNLTADFDLLRKMAQISGGSFYTLAQWERAQQELSRTEARSVIRSEERYDSLINLKWIFFALLLLIGAEWFLRKYFGGY